MGNNKKQNNIKPAATGEKLMSPVVLATIIISCIILVAMIVLAVVAKTGYFKNKKVAVNIGDDAVNAIEYAYFYSTSASNFMSSNYYLLSYMGYDFSKAPSQQTTSMGTTSWESYFTGIATTNVVQTSVLYQEAKKAGFTADQQKIDETVETYIDSLKTTASENSLTLSKYLTNVYGSGMTEALYRGYLADSLYAAQYSQSLTDAIEVTDSELETYKDEHIATYTNVTYRANYYTFDDTIEGSKAEALALAKEHIAAGTSAEAFEAFAHTVLDASEVEEKADTDITLISNSVASNVSDTSLRDWLLSSDRKEGDVTYFEQSGQFAAVYFISASLMDYNLENVRHILVLTDADSDGTVTDEEDAAAKAKIDEIYASYKAGAMTEDAFSALAQEKSEDSSSANGGLIADMTKGQYVEEFENWAFDESRKAGDTEIIKTTYGYHLMYYVGEGEVYWKTACKTAVTNDKYNTMYEAFEKNYTITYDDAVIDSVTF